MKRLILAVALVALCMLLPVFAAEMPPEPLARHVLNQTLKHDGKCNVASHKNVECLIFVDPKHNLVWLVLFNPKLEPTHVIAVGNDERINYVWVRSDFQV